MVNKDYYAILGISRWATDEEIKRAYKQNALKHHPDKNRDDLDAEKKFTDVSEAYEMLSDPYKRSIYDRCHSDYFNPNFRRSFSTGNNYRSSYVNGGSAHPTYDSFDAYFKRCKDPTTFYDLYLTLDEINTGTTRKLKVTRQRFKPELQMAEKDEKVLEIQVKPGWKEGTKITFENEGDENDQHTIAGDIVFIIRDKPHPIFQRANSDLIYRVQLTLKQALLGTLIVIPFLDSTKASYQLRTYREIITPQTEKRFPNEGLPYPKDLTRRGDLIVKFDILFPKILNQEQRTSLDSAFSNSTDFYQPFDSVLHTTTIDQTQEEEEQQQTDSISSSSPPPSSSNTNHQHHPKPPHRQIKNFGRQKSPVPPNLPKAPSVRLPPPPVPPRPSPTAMTKETVF